MTIPELAQCILTELYEQVNANYEMAIRLNIPDNEETYTTPKLRDIPGTRADIVTAINYIQLALSSFVQEVTTDETLKE